LAIRHHHHQIHNVNNRINDSDEEKRFSEDSLQPSPITSEEETKHPEKAASLMNL
jgi:hypothetical protein